MKNRIKERISKLRAEMEKSGIDGWYLSGTDPHQSEYLPDYWQIRNFISGFNGSMGFMAVTQKHAALWTDSRYFLQAADQLKDTGISLMKLRVEGTPSPAKWLGDLLPNKAIIGTDASCMSTAQYQDMQKDLALEQLQLSDCGDLMEAIWTERPQLPGDPVFEHDTKYTGQSRLEKIEAIRAVMSTANCEACLLTALDEIAWAFNLRGNDISFNPVFVSFALITHKHIHLYLNPEKIASTLNTKLTSEGITIKAYQAVYDDLKNINSLLIDPDRTNQALIDAIAPEAQINFQLSAATCLKAIKSDHEISMFRKAMRKDGVAMVKFLHWLYANVGKTAISEYDVLLKLNEFRAQQENFMGPSFHSIVGYNETGAVVHRSVSPETAAAIHAEGILLMDSGGQYLEGTTDITRTVSLSEPSQLAKEDFTLALKGTIGLADLKFPANTAGCNLDLAARQAMWKTGRNYGHGTGHGIGFFLNVHEGPMSIRQEYNNRVIEPGMVLSDEPAFYREGQYGIRTENVIVCKEWQTNEYGHFLQFETLTLCPIDRRLIAKELLSPDEIDWLNNYHKACFEELAPALNNEEKAFLQELTKAI